MVFPHRRALRARLRPFRYIDGTELRISFSSRPQGDTAAKSWPGDPSHPCLYGGFVRSRQWGTSDSSPLSEPSRRSR